MILVTDVYCAALGISCHKTKVQMHSFLLGGPSYITLFSIDKSTHLTPCEFAVESCKFEGTNEPLSFHSEAAFLAGSGRKWQIQPWSVAIENVKLRPLTHRVFPRNVKLRVSTSEMDKNKLLDSECKWIFRTCTNALNVYITMMHFISYDNLQSQNSGKPGNDKLEYEKWKSQQRECIIYKIADISCLSYTIFIMLLDFFAYCIYQWSKRIASGKKNPNDREQCDILRQFAFRYDTEEPKG